ncbi:Gfo/Idh/MocA family oxidoreductase [bacterium]|nr:Gfo/Idh/MocA family oxidoreductase [bacterium]
MEQTVFGIIGTGGIAQSQHLPNASRSSRIRLKTLCDLREDVLRNLQAKYSVPVATNDYREVLADPEIECVIVATKEDAQAALTIEALRAGKHVYVEKPLAKDSAECQKVVAAEEESGHFAAVGFNRRMAPAYRMAREIVAKNGGAFNMHYRIADNYAFGWGKNFPPSMRLYHEVCHIFDVLRWFADSEVKTVYCLEARPDDETITLQFESGAIATIQDSGYATADLPKERMEIISHHGAVTVEEFVELRSFGYPDYEAVYTFPGHSHPDKEYTHKYLFREAGAQGLYGVRRSKWMLDCALENPESSEMDSGEIEYYRTFHKPYDQHRNYMVDKGWLAALENLAESARTGQPPETARVRDGLQTLRICEAAMKSRESKQPIEVGE